MRNDGNIEHTLGFLLVLGAVCLFSLSNHSEASKDYRSLHSPQEGTSKPVMTSSFDSPNKFFKGLFACLSLTNQHLSERVDWSGSETFMDQRQGLAELLTLERDSVQCDSLKVVPSIEPHCWRSRASKSVAWSGKNYWKNVSPR